MRAPSRMERGAAEARPPSSRYVVVSGDLMGSSRLRPGERSALQKRLLLAVDDANSRFADDLVVRFGVTLGDEFQGLLGRLSRTPEAVEFWRSRLYPYRARFGVGAGRLYSRVTPASTALMDGECFHRSRMAVERAKTRGPSVVYVTGVETADIALEAIWRLLDSVQASWKELHFRRFWSYRELHDISRVAAQEGVSKSAVSQSLRRAGYDSVLAAEGAMVQLLRLAEANKR